MSNARLQQLFSAFDASADLDATDRARYVSALGEADPELAAELVRLLRADDGASNRIEELIESGARDAVNLNDSPTPGEQLGAYELLEVVGQGGSGTVYRARRRTMSAMHHSESDVAVKVIHPGMNTAEVLRRFARERQLLARMNNPGITQIHASGATADGLPYFVMDYIPSRPIDRYCANASASVRDRVALFIAACRIMEHAHANDILHRDLKPSNILVTERSGAARPVIIDFGIARVLTPAAGEEQLTRIGRSPGTPAYMSPEQRRMASSELDQRADVYSLGVVLFELLTGTRPSEDPRPSACVRLMIQSDVARARKYAGERATEPEALAALLRRDLDAIVVRAIEEDRAWRFPSVREFADALESVTSL